MRHLPGQQQVLVCHDIHLCAKDDGRTASPRRREPRIRPNALFLLVHGDIHRAVDLKAQLSLDLIAAEGLDGLIQHQLLLGNVNVELRLEAFGNFLGGDGAEQAAAVARPWPSA